MSKVYIDSESCGLHSMMVLLQYAEEDGPIHLYDVWKRPIRETLRLIEWLCENTVVGFNLAFDWFQIVKVYTTFRLANPDSVVPSFAFSGWRDASHGGIGCSATVKSWKPNSFSA